MILMCVVTLFWPLHSATTLIQKHTGNVHLKTVWVSIKIPPGIFTGVKQGKTQSASGKHAKNAFWERRTIRPEEKLYKVSEAVRLELCYSSDEEVKSTLILFVYKHYSGTWKWTYTEEKWGRGPQASTSFSSFWALRLTEAILKSLKTETETLKCIFRSKLTSRSFPWVQKDALSL